MPTDEREGLRERVANLRGYIKAGDPLPDHALRTIEEVMLALAPAPEPERDGHTLADYIGALAALAAPGHGRTAKLVERDALLLLREYRATPTVQPQPDTPTPPEERSEP